MEIRKIKIVDNIDLIKSELLRGEERIKMDKQIKKVLWYIYGIKVKTIKINNCKNYFGYTFYLPYCIITTNDEDREDVVSTFWNAKVYKSLIEILYSARKGELELV